jgi:hypothetical protein
VNATSWTRRFRHRETNDQKLVLELLMEEHKREKKLESSHGDR